MRRFVVFDRAGSPLFDLDGRIESCVRTEVLNGEHKLDLVTTQPLEEGMRILVRDGTGRWREWVVDETDEAHEGGRSTVGTYGCTWSMQYDLATEDGGELWPGTYDPISAESALSMVLGDDSAWEAGDVTVGGLSGTSLYDGSRWEYLSQLLDTWGGEMEPRIVVDANSVTHRYVDWLAHVGSEVAQRRYDYGGDCDAIRRHGAPGPRYCRIVPRGGRDATDNDGVKYSERCGVEEEPYQADATEEFVHPANADYIEDKVAALDFRVPDGHGGLRYPTKVVCYDLDYEGDQEELLAKAMEDAPNHTRPKATYEVSVRHYAPAGTDPHGTQLGDEVHVVDATFGEAPLRIEARVVEVQVNELDEADAQLTIGECRQTMASAFKSLRSAIDAAEERTRRIEGAGTLVYLQTLLDQLNAEINATGGYAYLVQNEGLIVYDIAVDDPLVGYNSATRTWASQVVQIKGGNIRIANEKNASFAGINDWKWKTMLVSGHIAAELVTAVNVVTGWLGNASGTYIDLDNNTANFGPVDGYHFTVDVHGITFFNGETQLGKYLASSTILGDSGKAHLEIDSDSLDVYGGSRSGSPVLVYSAGYNTNSSYIHFSDYSGTCYVNLDATGFGSSIAVKGQSSVCAFLGWDSSKLVTRYDLGRRKESTTVGNYSLVGGVDNTASGTHSTALGYNNVASGNRSIVGGQNNSCDSTDALVMGHHNTAGYSSQNVLIIGEHNDAMEASGKVSRDSALIGEYLKLYSDHKDCLIVGRRNSDSSTNVNDRFVVGNGSYINGSSYTRNLLRVGGPDSTDGADGYMLLSGTMTAKEYVTSSDRRLKEHVAYLGDEASEFVRSLKPVLYAKDGSRHVGFYAQDVRDSEPDEWDTVTVSEWRTEESADFDTLTLDYNAIIAPLVAYAQGLERRIDQQQRQIDVLTERLDALEARP